MNQFGKLEMQEINGGYVVQQNKSIFCIGIKSRVSNDGYFDDEHAQFQVDEFVLVGQIKHGEVQKNWTATFYQEDCKLKIQYTFDFDENMNMVNRRCGDVAIKCNNQNLSFTSLIQFPLSFEEDGWKDVDIKSEMRSLSKIQLKFKGFVQNRNIIYGEFYYKYKFLNKECLQSLRCDLFKNNLIHGQTTFIENGKELKGQFESGHPIGEWKRVINTSDPVVRVVGQLDSSLHFTATKCVIYGKDFVIWSNRILEPVMFMPDLPVFYKEFDGWLYEGEFNGAAQKRGTLSYVSQNIIKFGGLEIPEQKIVFKSTFINGVANGQGVIEETNTSLYPELGGSILVTWYKSTSGMYRYGLKHGKHSSIAFKIKKQQNKEANYSLDIEYYNYYCGMRQGLNKHESYDIISKLDDKLFKANQDYNKAVEMLRSKSCLKKVSLKKLEHYVEDKINGLQLNTLKVLFNQDEKEIRFKLQDQDGKEIPYKLGFEEMKNNIMKCGLIKDMQFRKKNVHNIQKRLKKVVLLHKKITQ